MTFLRVSTGECTATLRELYAECTEEERRLSPEFYRCYSSGRGTAGLTPFAGIRLVGQVLSPVPRPPAGKLLAQALSESLPETPEIDVAVSGGIDSWLLAALLQSRGCHVRAWYLETSIRGYCERDQVEEISRTLGIAFRSIKVTTTDFVTSLPEFVAVTERPIYNLHPVSKYLLAKALRERGISTVVTGDGADQAMRQEWDCDLLPLTLRCFQRAGICLIAPFLSELVLNFCDRRYLNKEPVRQLAKQLGIPEIPKRPTLFPAVDLPPHPRAILPSIDPPILEDRACCLAYTTGLLLQAMEGHRRCAESLA
jgi:PP-loop superfamily ATP-utilizing enzyme